MLYLNITNCFLNQNKITIKQIYASEFVCSLRFYNKTTLYNFTNFIGIFQEHILSFLIMTVTWAAI